MKMIKNVRRLKVNASKPFYVTTPIYYVNAAPHIGHLYSSVIADAICRFQKLIGNHQSVRLCTGTDEHGSKIQQAAQQHGVPIANYCDDISARYKNVFEQTNIAYSDFIRTTELRHTKAVQHFWNSLSNRGHIYLSQYSGWYCVSDETFLTETQLKQDESNGKRFSIESGHPVEWTEETNYMFRLSKLQDDLIYWIKQGRNRVRPAKFEKILLDMLNEPLCDVSVSRPTNRVHWGIPVPNDESQTVYVWLDALINYLTSAGYPDDKYRIYWPPNVQVIGKDILKFHGIYWPAFLIAAGLEPPEQLFVHSHWTVDGQKMSKSKQNVVDPVEAAALYTMEGLRYFLLREGVAHSDGNYSSVKALRILNSELADTLGNLLSRACAKSLNPRQIYPGLDAVQLENILQLDAAKRLQEAILRLQGECEHHYNDNNFYLVVDNIMATLHAANNFFESLRPWELKSVTGSSADTGSTIATTVPSLSQRSSLNIANATRLETIIAMTMDTLRLCGIALQPIVPELSGRLLDKLNVPEEQRLWRNLSENFTDHNKCATPPRALRSIDAVLFRRILLKSDSPQSPHRDNQPQQIVPAKEKRAKKSKTRQAAS